MNPASVSIAISQKFIQNFLKASMKASSELKNDKDFTQLPDLVNMTVMLYEPENIQLLYNISNISINTM